MSQHAVDAIVFSLCVIAVCGAWTYMIVWTARSIAEIEIEQEEEQGQ